MLEMKESESVEDTKLNENVDNKDLSYTLGYMVPVWSSYPHHPYS